MSGIEWFYLKGDQRKGPFTAAEIDALLLAGTLTPASEVWCEGMGEPRRIADLPDRMAALLAERARTGLIAPRQRYYARYIDMTIGMILLAGPVLGFLFKMQGAEPSFWIVPAFLVLFLGMGVLEAICLALWGTTPGKWIFGLKVQDRQGRRPSFAGSIKRQLLLAVYGFGLGVPLVSFITMFFAHRAASRGEALAWDRRLGYEVRHYPVSRWRFITFALVPGALIVAAEIISAVPGLSARNFGFGMPWMNPTTHDVTQLPMGWRMSSTPDQAAAGYYVFIGDGGYAILAHDRHPDPDPDLATYAERVKTDPDLGKFWGEARKTDERGRPYIELNFSRQIDAVTYGSAVRLWQVAPGDFWRLILAWRADEPATRSEEAASALQRTLPRN